MFQKGMFKAELDERVKLGEEVNMLEKGNGIVLCLCKDISAIDENNYFVPIEYI